jgi:peptidoglycan/LPS O-acetylase OafA/YrhL
MAVPAVDVFFVLSGYVIAHVHSTAEKDWGHFVASRVTRIYSVALPAIALTTLLDWVGSQHDPATYLYSLKDSALSPGVFLRSVTFLGGQWNNGIVPGTDGPYWSLGFEVWYYIAFALFVFLPRRWRWVAVAGVLVFIGPKVAVLFPIWLLGVAAYRFTSTARLSKRAGWFAYFSPIALLSLYAFVPHNHTPQYVPFSFELDRVGGILRDYFYALTFFIHLIGFVTVSEVFLPLLLPYVRIIRWIAGATFSIYLVHRPVMYFISANTIWPKSSIETRILVLCLTPPICLLFAQLFERPKLFYRRLLDFTITKIFGWCTRIRQNA